MKIIGLTGGSGAGKGEVCAILQKYGIPSINTDAVYHELLLTCSALKNELTDAFGDSILDDRGAIDRKRLAATVFEAEGHAARLHTLNAITHKYIMAKTWELMKGFQQNGARAAVIDAPQLFEAGVDKQCDLLLAVVASPAARIARITARDGITEKAAQNRLAAQHNDDFYRSHCHYILENDADTATLEQSIQRFLKDSALGL